VDCGQEALCYILVLWQPIIIQVCEGFRILQYFAENAIILYGDSFKCIHIKMVSDIIHTYHTAIQTSWLQGTIIRLLIRVRVFYFPPIL
jgi:hypothetical protein